MTVQTKDKLNRTCDKLAMVEQALTDPKFGTSEEALAGACWILSECRASLKELMENGAG